jgi:hypothetical protein
MATASIRIFVFNERVILEEELKKGEDPWDKNTKRLLEEITRDRDNIYDRRKEITGFGTICAEGKFIDLLEEALKSYQ